jgi:hypothetical protein
MLTDLDIKSLVAVAKLRKEAQRANLIEHAKGRRLFSWRDLAYLLPLGMFAYIVFADSRAVQPETFALLMLFVMILQWHHSPLEARLDSLTKFLLETDER